MEFRVSLESFEGPLDLMLHLVRSNKLDLFSLNLDVLAAQYIAYIHDALDLGLDVSSEYLIELSTLLEYKSRKLLPRKPAPADDPGTYLEDPAEQIARRLREYQSCKLLAHQLEQLAAARERRIEREASSRIEAWQKTTIEEGTLSIAPDALSRAFIRALRRHRLLSPWQTKVEVKELSVEERMVQILANEKFTAEPVLFDVLLEDVSTLHEAIVTFLALLELIHEGSASAKVIECEEQESDEPDQKNREHEGSGFEYGKDDIWISRIAVNH